MRSRIHQQILYLHQDDVPHYKKKGSVVRNSYFWALRSITEQSGFGKDWEFADEVWPALCRMLTAFAEAGYLYHRETILEFAPADEIPSVLKPVATWADFDDIENEGSEDEDSDD
ncbi:MAG: hypothetical protein ICV77_10255 [Cyanobacteria bacterium Co-bin8]|nr:hypothetical protein [Cyanobacteria bacterium Co-bin8]